MQTFTAPISGNYKLEVWGAQGAEHYRAIPGLGGYAQGIAYILGNTTISVCIGGRGSYNVKNGNAFSIGTGGYNGGGDGQFGGGGATHIAKNNRGILQNYINNKDEIYIVAGGGGGGDAGGRGGSGGGVNGGDGIDYEESDHVAGKGGTQDTGGDGYNQGSFGCGGEAIHDTDSAGAGGGGWYGGGSCFDTYSCAGGGSGYIGGVSNALTIAGDQTFPKPKGGTETGHSGDGYAIISWISPNL